jgi:hypothetical protein
LCCLDDRSTVKGIRSPNGPITVLIRFTILRALLKASSEATITSQIRVHGCKDSSILLIGGFKYNNTM